MTVRIRRPSLGIILLIGGLIAALCTIPLVPHRAGIDRVDATVPLQGAPADLHRTLEK